MAAEIIGRVGAVDRAKSMMRDPIHLSEPRKMSAVLNGPCGHPLLAGDDGVFGHQFAFAKPGIE